MKNQYFGDESDYRKYGVLRVFADQERLRVGVCWMLTPDDGRTDGVFTDYLDDAAAWRSCDPELFDALAGALAGGRERSVAVAEALGLVPGADYYGASVPGAVEERSEWFARAMQHLERADLVFFDPDNGLEVRSRPYGSSGSEKYVYWSEVAQAYRRGQSVLVFQYYPRRKRDEFHRELTSDAAKHTGATNIHVLRTSRVAYLLVGQRRHRASIDQALRRLSDRWSGQVKVLSMTGR